MKMKNIVPEMFSACASAAGAGAPALKIGWGRRSINPGKPVAITGQHYLRVSLGEYSPVYVSALVLENGEDAVIFVSADMVALRGGILDRVKERLEKLAPEIPADKLIMNVTHTHAGPNFSVATPAVPGMTYMPKEEIIEFLTTQISDAIIDAWKDRAPGSVAYGYGFATVGHSRRTIYLNTNYAKTKSSCAPGYDVPGLGKMYGNTNDPAFSHYEAGTDAFINLFYTFDANGKLNGAIINVPCPSQTNEHAWQLHPGFWGPARDKIRAKHGDIGIICQSAAAGDLAPRQLHYLKAELRRYQLKYPEKVKAYLADPLRYPEHFFTSPEEEQARREKDLLDMMRAEDIANRIASAFEEVLEWAQRDKVANPVLRHKVENVQLERRMVSEAELKKAREDNEWIKNEIARIKASGKEVSEVDRTLPSRLNRTNAVFDRYEAQKTDPTLEMPIHAVRIGDVAFASNRFELYLDFMHRMQARSPYTQTFIVQLTAVPGEDGGSYLATKRAAANLGYSATLFTNKVSADGGQQLVDNTLRMLNEMK